ncbi:MAG: TonB-dependent receptor [Verrucomicrobia bacterium]|nr:TonB-dependent receptor [Verrucomicrobiota bacterium]
MTTILPLRSRPALRALVALAVLAPALVRAQAQTPAPATVSTESVQRLDSFEVTGSRIKRLDHEGPLPVIQFTADDIAKSGVIDVQGFIRKLPQNTLSYTNEAVFGFTPGAAGANLRGLGVEYTLTLINGRRAAPYGIGAGGTATFANTQSIPLAAIEKIEVLTDGASAIYGSDAVAGVINYIMKKDFEGFQLTTSYLNTFETDLATPGITLSGGLANPKGNAFFTVDWQKRNAQARRDRDWNKSSDFTRIGGLNFPTLGGQQPYGAPAYVRAISPTGVLSGPVYATSPTAYTTQQLLTNTAGSAAYNAALTDPNTDAWESPETERYSVVGMFNYHVSDRVTAFFETSFTRLKVLNSVHPVALDSLGETVPGVGNLVVPAANPFNPLGVNRTDGGAPTDVRVWYRMRDLGNRVSHVTDHVTRLVGGLRGKLWSDWEWQGAMQYMNDNATNRDAGHSIRSALRTALRGTTAATAYNVFGAFSGGPSSSNQATVLNGFAAQRTGDNSFDTYLYDLTASGTLFTWRDIKVGAATGAEYRRENISQVRDPASANGDFTASGGGSNLFGRRHATSYFAEVRAPLLKQVEVAVAGRYEDYSDFGTAFKPKYSLALRPAKWALVRGSMSEGFRAPALIQLFQAQSVAFQSTVTLDPHRRNPANPAQQAAYTSLLLRRGGNPGLTPETSRSYYAGLVLEPTRGALKNLSFSVDWSNIYIYDRIALPSVAVSMRENDSNIVQRTAPTAEDRALNQPGEVTELRLTYQNLARRTTEGLDFGLGYRWNHEKLGRITADWRGSYLYKYVTQSARTNAPIENRGSTSLPEWRWTSSLHWQKGALGATVIANYVGKNDAFYQPQVILGTVPSTWMDLGPWTTYDVQASYDFRNRWMKDTRLIVGVENVTDRPPPFYDNDASGYDPLVANPFGAMYYVRLTRRF